jgi:hypothetical protein
VGYPDFRTLTVFLLQQPQQPIVVHVDPQPPITPPISYGGMLLSALGLVGVIVVAAFIVGGVIGALIIWRRRRQVAAEDPGGRSPGLS